MKALKYTLVVLLIALAIVAGVVHYYRESVVRKIANAALGDLGIAVTDLSVATIGTRIVRLEQLTLEQDDGTSYEITDLTFPLSFPSESAEQIFLGELAMIPSGMETAPTPLAPLLRTLLRLPDSVPNTEVTVDRLSRPGFPSARDVVWRTDGPRQRLTLRIEAISLTVGIDHIDADVHHLAVNATTNDASDALSVQMDVRNSDGGVVMTGDVALESAPWVPVLASAGLLPADLVALDAGLAGPLTIEIDDDDKRSARIEARLSLADELTAQYRATGDLTVGLSATAASPFTTSLAYPSLEWSARIEQVDLRIGTDTIRDVPLQLSALECRSGLSCVARASIDAGPVELETVTIAAAEVAAPLTVSIGDITRVDLAPESVVKLTGIESAGVTVASIETTQLAGAQLIVDTDGWRVDVERLNLSVDAATNNAGLLASAPLRFSAVHVRDGGATVDATITIEPKATSFSWDGTGIVMPGVAGTMSLRNGRLSAALELADDALSADVEAAHDITAGTGTVVLRDAELRFDAGKLSTRLARWPYAWDVLAGRWTAALELHWQAGADGIEYAGAMTHRADALAGQYRDMAFAGLSTTLSATVDAPSGVDVSPASLEVAVIDIGVPLKQVAADYSLDVAEQSVQVDNLSLSTLGGRVTADPFLFGMQAPVNDITLRPQSIQLPFIMKLVDFGDIELEGSISGVIPVTIKDMQLTIANGQLQSDPPGGVIRYLPGVELVKSGTSESALDIASRALANFRFDSLTSAVDYLENGEMTLKMRLSGSNPDLDDGRPVILNLEVDNNIPQMLRSLRATRTIEDVLAERSAR